LRFLAQHLQRRCVNLFLLLISLTVAEDKNSILTRKHCGHLSHPVLSVRPGSKYPNTRRDIVLLILIKLDYNLYKCLIIAELITYQRIIIVRYSNTR
jgi:hypothetical protein